VAKTSAQALATAFGLALAAAVSLGLSRFSYALLLPGMREDLHWSYLVAGAMNTANAAGYLCGALLAPRWLARHDAQRLMLAGGFAAVALLAAHGLVASDAALYVLRWATGVASAASFVSGGVLAARLAQGTSGVSPGLLLGLYYGGTGAGIVASALLVPRLQGAGVHAWQPAWWGLAATALLFTFATLRFTRDLHGAAPAVAATAATRFRWRSLGWGLAGYLMFGLGYIGYMTFVITLLREQRLAPAEIVAFYVVLGLGVMASPFLWARLLQRARGGGALSLLDALLALATLLPVLSPQPAVAFASGALFGAVFLSVVASTTAMVRHNLPQPAWSAGIAAFTIVFAAGQIVGPSLVGWLADGPGGLARGFAGSAALLALGAALASRQRPLPAA
jgi:predicted MFS family arabinose efflux permease